MGAKRALKPQQVWAIRSWLDSKQRMLDHAQASLNAWLERREDAVTDYVFPSRIARAEPISTRQYARLVEEWVNGVGLGREDDGTHSLRRTKAAP